MHNVFVYGTLREGERYHGLLKGSRRLAALARVQGTLLDTGHGYPALIAGQERVAGELYEVSDGTLARLDELEDYYGPGDERNEYERRMTGITLDSGTVSAWCYIYARETVYPTIPEGDWRLYLLRREAKLLYFAYGSCMDLERITAAGRAGDFSDCAGRGTAENCLVRFTLRLPAGGRADLVEEGGESRTEGKLYRISPECLEQYLYVREGVHEGIYRPVVLNVQCEDGVHRPAVSFVVRDKQGETAPPEHYIKEILRGAQPVVSAGYFEQLQRRCRLEL